MEVEVNVGKRGRVHYQPLWSGQWNLTFPMEKGNGIVSPLGREGKFVKPVKREEGKEGTLHNPCGTEWKKERPSKFCSLGGERSSILREGMRGLRDVDLWNPSFNVFC